jgi:hypothetical protein
LEVKEISVTKGSSYKKIRIMGRGRTGVGMHRSTHVMMKIDKVNFTHRIDNARTAEEKRLWQSRKRIVEKARGVIADAANKEVPAITASSTTTASATA